MEFETNFSHRFARLPCQRFTAASSLPWKFFYFASDNPTEIWPLYYESSMFRVHQTCCGDWLQQIDILDILNLLWSLPLQWPSVECFRALGSLLATGLSWQGCCPYAHSGISFFCVAQTYRVEKENWARENQLCGTGIILSFHFSYDNKVGIENIKRLDISNIKDSCRKFMFL